MKVVLNILNQTSIIVKISNKYKRRVQEIDEEPCYLHLRFRKRSVCWNRTIKELFVHTYAGYKIAEYRKNRSL